MENSAPNIKTDIKIRLVKLQRTQVDVIEEVRKRYGEPTLQKQRMSEWMNGKWDGKPFGERLNEEVEAVLTDWEAAR